MVLLELYVCIDQLSATSCTIRSSPCEWIIRLLHLIHWFRSIWVSFPMNFSLDFLCSIGAVLDHLADILSSPGLSAAEDLKTLPQDYQDFERNFQKFISHAQNVDSKFFWSIVIFLTPCFSSISIISFYLQCTPVHKLFHNSCINNDDDDNDNNNNTKYLFIPC